MLFELTPGDVVAARDVSFFDAKPGDFVHVTDGERHANYVVGSDGSLRPVKSILTGGPPAREDG